MKLVVGAGALALLFILFLVHTYVHPLTSQAAAAHKVAPLPGMADTYPYNTREWQEAYKSRRTTVLSGAPQRPDGTYGPGRQ